MQKHSPLFFIQLPHYLTRQEVPEITTLAQFQKHIIFKVVFFIINLYLIIQSAQSFVLNVTTL
jgi:hypothetical protein